MMDQKSAKSLLNSSYGKIGVKMTPQSNTIFGVIRDIIGNLFMFVGVVIMTRNGVAKYSERIAIEYARKNARKYFGNRQN